MSITYEQKFQIYGAQFPHLIKYVTNAAMILQRVRRVPSEFVNADKNNAPKSADRELQVRAAQCWTQPVPEQLTRLGVANKGADGRDNFAFLDFDVNKGAKEDQYGSHEEALESTGKICQLAEGVFEVCKSTGGLGIHVAIPFTKYRPASGWGSVLAYALANKSGVRRDRAVLGTQCRWVGADDPAPGAFELVKAPTVELTQQSLFELLVKCGVPIQSEAELELPPSNEVKAAVKGKKREQPKPADPSPIPSSNIQSFRKPAIVQSQPNPICLKTLVKQGLEALSLDQIIVLMKTKNIFEWLKRFLTCREQLLAKCFKHSRAGANGEIPQDHFAHPNATHEKSGNIIVEDGYELFHMFSPSVKGLPTGGCNSAQLFARFEYDGDEGAMAADVQRWLHDAFHKKLNEAPPEIQSKLREKLAQISNLTSGGRAGKEPIDVDALIRESEPVFDVKCIDSDKEIDPLETIKKVLYGKDRWFTLGMLGVLTGETGVGKSSLSLQFLAEGIFRNAILALDGLPGSGISCHKEITAALIQFENDRDDLEEMLENTRKYLGLTKTEFKKIRDRLHIIDNEQQPIPTGDTAIRFLIDVIKQHKPNVILVDPGSDLYAGDIMDQPAVSRWLRAVARVALLLNVAIILVLHTTKPQKENSRGRGSIMNSRYRAIGTNAWSTVPRMNMDLRPLRNNNDDFWILEFAKRGDRVGVTDEVGAPTKQIVLQRGFELVNPDSGKKEYTRCWKRVPDPRNSVDSDDGGGSNIELLFQKCLAIAAQSEVGAKGPWKSFVPYIKQAGIPNYSGTHADKLQKLFWEKGYLFSERLDQKKRSGQPVSKIIGPFIIGPTFKHPTDSSIPQSIISDDKSKRSPQSFIIPQPP